MSNSRKEFIETIYKESLKNNETSLNIDSSSHNLTKSKKSSNNGYSYDDSYNGIYIDEEINYMNYLDRSVTEQFFKTSYCEYLII
jgi:hypothetical protein